MFIKPIFNIITPVYFGVQSLRVINNQVYATYENGNAYVIGSVYSYPLTLQVGGTAYVSNNKLVLND